MQIWSYDSTKEYDIKIDVYKRTYLGRQIEYSK